MIRAVLFDLDGLMVDSEPLWRKVEMAIFAEVGVTLTEEDCIRTTGLRIDEVVAHWHRERPWHDPSVPELATRIVDSMVRRAPKEAEPKPGVHHAIDLCEKAGVRLAVASSSPERLIRATLDGFGVTARFAAIVSAEHETYGKPHPAVFLRAASALDVPPTDCLVLEDSVNGLVAAKAARMRCVVVPERPDPRFALADVVLESLERLDASTLA